MQLCNSLGPGSVTYVHYTLESRRAGAQRGRHDHFFHPASIQVILDHEDPFSNIGSHEQQDNRPDDKGNGHRDDPEKTLRFGQVANVFDVHAEVAGHK